MEIAKKIGGTVLQVSCAAVISMMLFPPGEVGKQLLVAATWYLAGFFTNATWRS